MIAWRTARIFLLYLTAMAIFSVMIAAVSDVPRSQPSLKAPADTAPRSAVNPVLVIPKDAPSIFEEV